MAAPARAGASNSGNINVEAIIRLGDGRRVVKVRVGDLRIGSLYAMPDGATFKLSWPRSARGFSIVEPASDSGIEQEIVRQCERRRWA
jgi:hypothetical protein